MGGITDKTGRFRCAIARLVHHGYRCVLVVQLKLIIIMIGIAWIIFKGSCIDLHIECIRNIYTEIRRFKWKPYLESVIAGGEVMRAIHIFAVNAYYSFRIILSRNPIIIRVVFKRSFNGGSYAHPLI